MLQSSQRPENGMSHPDNQRNTPLPVGTMLLVVVTVALVVAMALLWATQWAAIHIARDNDSTIPDAERAALATPLFWVGVGVLSAAWVVIWRVRQWPRAGIPVAIAALALLLAGWFFWRASTVDQPVTITTYACTPGANPFTAAPSDLLARCDPARMDTARTIGTATDRAMFTAGSGDAQSSTTGSLPVGHYHAWLTTTAPADTASIVLVANRDSGPRAVGILDVDDPSGDASRTWSTRMTMSPDTGEYLLLFYRSPQPILDNAAISFAVEQCRSGTPEDFDPADCTPMTLEAPVMIEVSPGTGPQAFREPIRTVRANVVTWTNLEARTYIFTPRIGNAYITANAYQFLVVPNDGPQTADADELTRSGDAGPEVVTIEISPESGTISFMIYVFPTTTGTIAMTP